MIIDLYIAKHVSKRLIAIMLLIVGLLLVENMFRLFQFSLQTGAPAAAAVAMLVYLLPEYLAIGIPISLMLAIMLTFLKLSKDNELTVMSAGQVSPFRLLRLPLMFGILLAALNALLVGYVEPMAEFRFAEQSYKTRSGAFGKAIAAGAFTSIGADLTLHVGSISPHSGELNGIFLEFKDDAGRVSYLTASRGIFVQSGNKDFIIFRLYDGQIVTTENVDETKPATMEFDRYDLAVALPEIPQFRRRGEAEKELTFTELIEKARGTGSELLDARSLLGEAQRRFILVLVPLLIPCLAVGLAEPPVRRNSSLQLMVGVFVLLVLIKALDFGSNIKSIPPAVVLWPAFFGFALFSIRAFYVFGFTASGHPLAAIYAFTDTVSKMIKRRKRFTVSN
ncbi:LptF/LptG family permease [Kordiimonas sp.]|uniref:LptF/LptG family permease n=1 Tax=Kordiimonas sp. TaxID=1970157 RepID=UPI003A8FC475